MNWSPISNERHRRASAATQLELEERPYHARASSTSPTSSATWLIPTRRTAGQLMRSPRARRGGPGGIRVARMRIEPATAGRPARELHRHAELAGPPTLRAEHGGPSAFGHPYADGQDALPAPPCKVQLGGPHARRSRPPASSTRPSCVEVNRRVPAKAAECTEARTLLLLGAHARDAQANQRRPPRRGRGAD